MLRRAEGEERPSFNDSSKMETAARCTHVVCIDCGTVDKDVLVFGSVIVPRILGTKNEIVAGRLGKGLARPGRSPAWLLDEPTDADNIRVRGFFDVNATRLKSGAIIVEAPPEKDGDEPDEHERV